MINLYVHATKSLLGRAAAADGAEAIRKALAAQGWANIIIATGASQFDTLEALVQAPGIDWSKVTMFHLDEYVGLSADHPASFRRYIKERFEARLPGPLKAAHYIAADAADPLEVCRQLGDLIRQHPIAVAFVGIGENGHLAFNDPPADFETEEPYLVVDLDEPCRRQQMGEGWFPSLEAVPRKAISMSVRWIMRSGLIVNSVPDERKAVAVRNTLEGPVSPLCPASILRQHPQCLLHLDQPAASLLKDAATLPGSFRFNGLMIDCARLMERHSYYFDLVDFMARWGMDTLLFHFSDDQGFGVVLPGFEDLASPGAFSADEVRQLIAHARSKGVEVIPELETFGHIRYLTNRPAYAHLFAGDATAADAWAFNAIDPTHPQTFALMERLVQATVQLFDSSHLHIGCDEVDMRAFCQRRGLDASTTWADYVNRVIGLARAHGRTPMIWGDHPTKDAVVAAKLRKDVILVDWRYEPVIDDALGGRLAALGFQDVVAAPSASCYETRFQGSRCNIENIRAMTSTAHRPGYAGVINTVWCPYRHYQEGILLALAYGAEAARQPDGVNLNVFHRKFAELELGGAPSADLLEFLTQAPRVEFEWQMAALLLDPEMAKHNHLRPAEVIALARRSAELGAELLPLLSRLSGNDTLRGMILAVRASWVAAEALSIQHGGPCGEARVRRYNEVLQQVRAETPGYVLKGRFSADCDKDGPLSTRLLGVLQLLPTLTPAP